MGEIGSRVNGMCRKEIQGQSLKDLYSEHHLFVQRAHIQHFLLKKLQTAVWAQLRIAMPFACIRVYT